MGGLVDVRTLVGPLADSRITVSCPATPVLLPAVTATALNGAVAAALDNVARHAGPDARAWVLVEDEEKHVTLGVRDDGAGFGAGRLAVAAAEGRLGVSHSIVGRVREVSELIDAVRSAAAGQPVFTPALAGLVLGEYRRLVRTDGRSPAAGVDTFVKPRLTERETEILRLVAKGLTYPQIAQRLTLSTRTVQNHVGNTLTKLQLHNKAQLVRYALENDAH